MKLATRYRKRAFQLQVQLPCALRRPSAYAWDVISSIEQKTIKIVDPHDSNVLDYSTDSDGAFLVDSNAILTVPLKEWLAVGCQRIRWEREDQNEIKDNALGMFKANYEDVFGTQYGDREPLGPTVFVGEIVLPREIREAFFCCSGKKELADLVHTFQFILAHELVHVFDALKYLVPAFKNWRAFWKNVFNQGCSIGAIYERLSDKAMFLDDYGHNNEFESIRYYWPSRADTWFQTRELDWSDLGKRER